MIRNGDIIASESIADFQQAVRATEDQIAKDEARLSGLMRSAQATADQVADLRSHCQEAVLRIDALESEVTKLSSGISLRRAEIDQTAAAVAAERAPRQQCEAEAAALAVTSATSRSAYIARGSAVQAEIVRIITSSNPRALQTQIEAQKVQIQTLRAHVDLCRASVAKLRGVAATAPVVAAAAAAAPHTHAPPSDETGAGDTTTTGTALRSLQAELAACHQNIAAAKAAHTAGIAAFHTLRDELRLATKRLCCNAESSEDCYHTTRKQYDGLNDTAAAKHCSMCQRPLSC